MHRLSMMVALLSAAPAMARPIEVVASTQQVTQAILPTDGTREWTLCSECAPGLGAIWVADPQVEPRSGAAWVKARVRTDVSMVGEVAGDVVCTVVPSLGPDGQLKIGSATCQLERFGEGLSWWAAPLVSQAAPGLAAVLAEILKELPALDLLGEVRGGALGPYSSEPSLRSPASASCVQSIRSFSIREHGLAIDVELSCDER